MTSLATPHRYLGLASCALVFVSAASTVASPAPTVPNWTGPYAGLNAGLSSGSYDFHGSSVDIAQISGLPTNQAQVVIVPGTTVSNPGTHKTSTGFNFGGQVGCNWQHGQSVVGLELQVDGLSQSGSTNSAFALPATALTNSATVTTHRNAKSNWDGSLRLRAGATHGQALYYGTLGVAIASVKVSEHDVYTISPGPCAEGSTFGPFPPFVNDKSETHQLTGWTIGIGGEWAISDRTSWGVEYRHTDFGSATYHLAGPASTDLTQAGDALPEDAKVGLTGDQIDVRYTWRFGK